MIAINLISHSSSTSYVIVEFIGTWLYFPMIYYLQLSDIDYPNSKDLDAYLNQTGLTLEYNSTFKNAISFQRSVVHVPTDVYDGGKFHCQCCS